MAEDLYATLGVPKSADAGAIKKAYRRLAKDLHPDKNPGNKQAESRFKAVNHANEVLSDPKKRKLYDEFGEVALREGFDVNQARAYHAWSSRQRAPAGVRGGYEPTFDLDDLLRNAARQDGAGDVFGDLFGRRRARGPTRGSDLESEVTIDFAASVRGATLELRPSGAGPVVTVRIPPGAEDNGRVRLAGQGMKSPNGGPPGDLVLLLHVTPHPFFKREGDDLHVELPITIAEAYRGGKVTVPTIDGQVSLKVPARTQSGSVLRLRGKGVAKKGRHAGDLYVHFSVKVPTGDVPELAELIDRLAALESSDVRRDVKL